jgi:phosphatidylglycerophosphate synthase
MDSGRKLPENLECPIDNFILKYIVDPLNPFFKSIGMTANGLTAISGVFGFISIYYLYKSNYKLAALFFMISYIFDVFDGNFARKYNMVSPFGDWFDHMKDNSVILGIIITIYYKGDIPGKNKIIALLLYIILVITMCKYLTLQENYYHSNFSVSEKEKSKSLDILQSFFNSYSSSDLTSELNKYKYFGPGTTNFCISMILYYFSFNLKK